MIKEIFVNLLRKYSDDESFISECWEEIYISYSADNRHYHNLEHLENMLMEMDRIKPQIKNPETLVFSIFYHDIIYIPGKSNNEYLSAVRFKERISETSFPNLMECVAQIEATKEHIFSTDNDTNILLDLDLSILGKRPGEYKKYSENIRKEFSIYPDSIYRNGRRKVLNHLLKLDPIYKTEFFKKEFENQAKENIKQELKELDQ